jgi:hypothetical protein
VAGLVFILRSVVRSLADTGQLFDRPELRMDLIFAGLSLAPLAAVIIKQSVLYDGWRHLYFIYPGILLIAVGGLRAWLQSLSQRPDTCGIRCGRRIFGIFIGLTLAYNITFMIRNHPHQQVYFNALVLGDKLTRLDLDYWGNTYRDGLEWLARNAPGDTVKVAYLNLPAESNLRFLPDSLQQRIRLVENREEADYFISNYRHWRPGIDAYLNRQAPYYGEEVFSIYVEESKVLGVYRVE